MSKSSKTFLQNIYGSFWGRMFKSTWVYRSFSKFTEYFSDHVLTIAQGFQDSLSIKTAGKQHNVVKLISVPLSAIHAKALVLGDTWEIGSAVIGQTVSDDVTVVQIQLPEECTSLAKDCLGEHLLLRDIDFVVKDGFFVLYGEPTKLFDFIHLSAGGPFYDIWVYGTKTEPSLGNFAIITGADLNSIPKAGETVLESYEEGLTEGRLTGLISRALGADLSAVEGDVRKVWVEGGYRFIDIEGFVHGAPARYNALVSVGDHVIIGTQLFDTHVLYMGNSIPEYAEVPAILLPVGPSNYLKIPNYMVQVKTYNGVRYMELQVTSGLFDDAVKDVIAKYPVTSISDNDAPVNALQYLMKNVFRNNLIVLKFKHVTGDSVQALQAIAQALSSSKALFTSISIALEPEDPGVDTISIIEADDSSDSFCLAGAGNPDNDSSDAVNLVYDVGEQKLGYM